MSTLRHGLTWDAARVVQHRVQGPSVLGIAGAVRQKGTHCCCGQAGSALDCCVAAPEVKCMG